MSPESQEAARTDLSKVMAGQALLLSRSGRVTLLLVMVVGILLLLELLAEIGIAFMPGVPQPFDWPRVFGSFDLLGWVAFGWGIAIWSGEPPSRRDTHWSMPVGVVTHDLLRVAAGWGFMMLAVVVLAVAGSGLAYASGGWRHIENAPMSVWTAFIVHASLMFGVGATIGLACERPVRLALIGVLTFMALTIIERGLGASAISPSRLLVGSIGLLTVAKGGFRAAFDSRYHAAVPWWLSSFVWAAIVAWVLPRASRAGMRRAGGARGIGMLGLLVFSASTADAQMCAGRPGRDAGNVQMRTTYAASADITSATIGGVLFGSRAFGGIELGQVDPDEFRGATAILGGTVGYMPPVGVSGRDHLCVSVSAEFGFGPNDVLGTSTDLDSRTIAAQVHWGFLIGDPQAFSLRPTVSIGAAETATTFSDSGDSQTHKDPHVLFGLGTGVGFNRSVAVLPYFFWPLNHDSADPIFSLSLSVSFGRR